MNTTQASSCPTRGALGWPAKEKQPKYIQNAEIKDWKAADRRGSFLFFSSEMQQQKTDW